MDPSSHSNEWLQSGYFSFAPFIVRPQLKQSSMEEFDNVKQRVCVVWDGQTVHESKERKKKKKEKKKEQSSSVKLYK